MKKFQLHFFRPPVGDEIGPQGELVERACKNKKDANKTGQSEAKQRGWRYLGIYSEESEQLDVDPENIYGVLEHPDTPSLPPIPEP